MRPPYAARDIPEVPDPRADDMVEGNGPFWQLAAIQADLLIKVLDWELTTKAEEELFELGWDDEDLDAFVQTLHAGPCKPTASQWCLEPKLDPPPEIEDRICRLADVYIMGFQRFKKVEQPGAHPKIYFKFTITEAPHRMLIYSIHLEKVVGRFKLRRKS